MPLLIKEEQIARLQSRAHQKARRSNPLRGRKRIIDDRPEVLRDVVERIFLKHSPEQISKSIKRENADEPLRWISHESIYRYIYAFPRGELRKIFIGSLRSKRRLRKDRSKVHSRRGQIQDAIPISERPKEVDDRKVPGHWEGDLIIGKKDAKSVREAFAEVFNEIDPAVRLPMTYDRGTEMAEHKALTEATGVKVYFADPSSPWQRGTNENTNGLIRQYFPKKTDFSKVALEEIKFTQNELNNRPRKILDGESPKKAFQKLIGALEN